MYRINKLLVPVLFLLLQSSAQADPLMLSEFYLHHRHWVTGAGGLTLLVLYYLISWQRIGKSPSKHTLITTCEPPDGLSASALRFIENSEYDRTCFAAALVNMAVKGHIKITEVDGVYTLEHRVQAVNLDTGEVAIIKGLFADAKVRVLNPQSHAYINSAQYLHTATLRKKQEVNYFASNSRYFITGVILAIANVIFTSLVMPASSAGKIYWFLMGLAMTGAGINWFFYEFLKAPNRLGHVLPDKIERFRLYLALAEKQELATQHAQGRTSELFERYLPYALALGVEQQWAEKFTDILTRVSAEGKTAYHPVWYSGSAWDDNHIGGFSASLGSQFTGAIEASSVAPATSSGSSRGSTFRDGGL